MLKTLFQKVIYQMKDAIDGVIGIIDEKGIIISCNQLIKIGESLPKILDATHDLVIAEGFTYRSINPDYVVFVEGEDKTAEDLSMLLAIVSNNIFYLYNENYDKSTFIKNIILDNIPQSNIFIKAKDLCVKTDAMRIVLLIKIENNSSLLNELKYLFYENDYIFTINEQDIVFVYEIKQKNYDKEIEKIVKQIIDTILSKQDKKVRID